METEEDLFPGMAYVEEADEGEDDGYGEYDEEADAEAFITGDNDWLHRDMIDAELFDSYAEEECGNDQQLTEAFVNYK